NCKRAVAESGSARSWLEAANVSRRAASSNRLEQTGAAGYMCVVLRARELGYGVMLGRCRRVSCSWCGDDVGARADSSRSGCSWIEDGRKPENLVATRNGGSAGEKE
ncbi:hypothetical protein JI435_118680, partial [Parastagonospora nodorum SN15]